MTNITDKQRAHWPQKMCQFEHNAHMGRLGMSEKCIITILGSFTTTAEAKQICVRIEQDLRLLKDALKTRVNFDDL